MGLTGFAGDLFYFARRGGKGASEVGWEGDEVDSRRSTPATHRRGQLRGGRRGGGKLISKREGEGREQRRCMSLPLPDLPSSQSPRRALLEGSKDENFLPRRVKFRSFFLKSKL